MLSNYILYPTGLCENVLNWYIPRLWERIFYKLYLIRQSDRNSVWTLHKKSVVETFAVSEAIPITIESDTGNHNELKVLDWKEWACSVRFQHAVGMAH